jgi:energy-coupling factor transporter ATP-binding protein EcfA2
MIYLPSAIVIDDVTYRIPANKSVFFIGANGSRKSTVLEIYENFLKSDTIQELNGNKRSVDSFVMEFDNIYFPFKDVLFFSVKFELSYVFNPYNRKYFLHTFDVSCSKGKLMKFVLSPPGYDLWDGRRYLSHFSSNNRQEFFPENLPDFETYLRDYFIKYPYVFNELDSLDEEYVESLRQKKIVSKNDLINGGKEYAIHHDEDFRFVKELMQYYGLDVTIARSSIHDWVRYTTEGPNINFGISRDTDFRFKVLLKGISDKYPTGVVNVETIFSNLDFFNRDNELHQEIYAVLTHENKPSLRWLEIIGITDIELEHMGQYFSIKVLDQFGNWVPISSIGRGLQRILVMGLLNENVGLLHHPFSETRPSEFFHSESFNDPRTYVFNEPEAFMHPNLQVTLGRWLSFFLRNGLKFFIETHSEYLIKYLQIQIASGELNRDWIEVINFGMGDDGQFMSQNIQFNADGSLTIPFYPGFNDQMVQLTLEHLKVLRDLN